MMRYLWSFTFSGILLSCVQEEAAPGGGGGPADGFESVADDVVATSTSEPDGNGGVAVRRIVPVQVINLSSVDDRDLVLNLVSDAMRDYAYAYAGDFPGGTGSVEVRAIYVSEWSQLRSDRYILAYVDDVTGCGDGIDAAGRANLRGMGMIIEAQYATRVETPARRRSVALHELGHNLGMVDNYPSATVMGDFAHAGLATTPQQRNLIYGPWVSVTFDEDTGLSDIRSLLDECAEYDNSRRD